MENPDTAKTAIDEETHDQETEETTNGDGNGGANEDDNDEGALPTGPRKKRKTASNTTESAASMSTQRGGRVAKAKCFWALVDKHFESLAAKYGKNMKDNAWLP